MHFAGAWIFEKQKYGKTLLSNESVIQIAEHLQAYMQTQKPFLDPSLSIGDLAKQLNIAPHQLSQVVNRFFHQNFFEYVNTYRIAESKRLLSIYSAKEKTILEIIYESGFNSKPVFNTTFKKNTGMTPGAFRKLYYKPDG